MTKERFLAEMKQLEHAEEWNAMGALSEEHLLELFPLCSPEERDYLEAALRRAAWFSDP